MKRTPLLVQLPLYTLLFLGLCMLFFLMGIYTASKAFVNRQICLWSKEIIYYVNRVTSLQIDLFIMTCGHFGTYLFPKYDLSSDL
jgi:hypothetical protein